MAMTGGVRQQAQCSDAKSSVSDRESAGCCALPDARIGDAAPPVIDNDPGGDCGRRRVGGRGLGSYEAEGFAGADLPAVGNDTGSELDGGPAVPTWPRRARSR
jgi:hypothetical protein